MIRKLKSGKYRLYSRKKDPKTGKRRNLGTFDTKEAAKQHERQCPAEEAREDLRQQQDEQQIISDPPGHCTAQHKGPHPRVRPARAAV